MLEQTLSIIKPNGVERNLVGKILSSFEEQGLKIVAIKRCRLTKAQAESFYKVHKERPFFNSLVEFMISGPVVVSVLEAENAIQKHRDIMGATDPAKAAPNTIRALYGDSLEKNTVHGSDAPETASQEIQHFFSTCELIQ